jgi:hypothetical protein
VLRRAAAVNHGGAERPEVVGCGEDLEIKARIEVRHLAEQLREVDPGLGAGASQADPQPRPAAVVGCRGRHVQVLKAPTIRPRMRLPATVSSNSATSLGLIPSA